MHHHPDRTPLISSIISGKGGVGKTMAAVNICRVLQRSGYRTALIDIDLGMSNCADMLNVSVPNDITDWIRGRCELGALLQSSEEITLISACNDPSGMSMDSEVMMDALDQVTAYLQSTHDFVLIDAPSGAGEMVLWALDASDMSVLMLVDEPTAISDVYRLCKFVYGIDPEYRFGCVVNRATDEQSALTIHGRFNQILDYFLSKDTEFIGFIPDSPEVKESIRKQRPLIGPQTPEPILNEFRMIAHNLIARSVPETNNKMINAELN